nr:uncharacterized protein CXorf51A-like [Camelus dromedarius]
MARVVTRKSSSPSTFMEQKASSTKGKKRKMPCQHRSRGSVKVTKRTMQVKRSLQGSLRRKASQKTTTPSVKSKKAKGPTLFGHYHRLNETLNQNQTEPEENQEVMEKPTTSSHYQGSQNIGAGPVTPETSAKSLKV